MDDTRSKGVSSATARSNEAKKCRERRKGSIPWRNGKVLFFGVRVRPNKIGHRSLVRNFWLRGEYPAEEWRPDNYLETDQQP
jgi:hypothetical protein